MNTRPLTPYQRWLRDFQIMPFRERLTKNGTAPPRPAPTHPPGRGCDPPPPKGPDGIVWASAHMARQHYASLDPSNTNHREGPTQ